eukprot:6193483-Pleurochrysis_carterae.AAC.5
MVLVVLDLLVLGARAQHLRNVALAHLASVVHVLLGQSVEVANHNHDRELGNGDGLEDRAVVLLQVIHDLLPVRLDIRVPSLRRVVVGHVVVLAKRVVPAVDESRGVDALYVLAVVVVVDEAVEAPVDHGEEGRHTEERLQPNLQHTKRTRAAVRWVEQKVAATHGISKMEQITSLQGVH